MRTVDRSMGWLLILSSCGHTVGAIVLVPFLSPLFVWSLGAGAAAALTGALNVLRSERPQDRVIAGLSLAGAVAWVAVCIGFGESIGNLADPRVVGNCVIATMLVWFSWRTLRTRPDRFSH